MKTTAYTRPSAPLCNNAATTHGGRRTRPRWRAWLAAGLLACAAGVAVAEDGEPGFSNYAQLASISVGGVAASFPVGLEDDPLHITVPPIQIGHCAPQVITMTAWDPSGRWHEVSALGQRFYLNDDTPTRSLSAAPLAFGTNVVDIDVRRAVSAGLWAMARYTLTIERSGPGTDAGLAGMALSSGTLTPAFDPAITSYSATVDLPSVAIAATAADCPAITVNGQPVASGGAAQVPLALGPNTVSVQSTAQDGTTRTFTLAITRIANANASLQGLTLSAGTLNPGFDGAVTRYTAAVPYLASVAVTPTPAAPTATLTVNGAPATAGAPQSVALQAGTTAITVGVTSEDGTATRAYTVDVTRAGPSTDARLSALALSAGVLSPAFNPAVLAYSALVGHATNAIHVVPTLASGDATLAVNGTPALSGNAVRIPLAPGLNTIAVQATAQDGTTQQTYTLRVTRAGAVNSARLQALSLSSGTPWPPVHPATLAYTARVASTTAAITLTPTPEDATASLLIHGSPVAPGAASAPIPVQPGHNTITLQITSTDGQQTASYSLDVLRGNADATLASLSLSDGSLGPAFDPAVLVYSASVPFVMTSVRVGLTLPDAEATARVGKRVLRSGHAAAVALAPGLNTVPVQVTSSDGTVMRTYLLRITREAAGAVSLSGNPAQFGPPQSLALSGDFVAAIAADDLDGDGRPDALARDYTRPELALLRGRGDGSLDAAHWLPPGISGARRLAVGDVHGDGWPDVLSVGNAQTLLTTGTGTGLGSAGFAAQPVALQEGLANDPPSVLLDVDGDDRDDIVSAEWTQGVVVLRSLGDSRFAAAQAAGTVSQVRHVVGQDVDGDGRMDLLLANEAGTLQLLPGAGGGTFGAPQDVPLGTTGQFRLYASPRMADVDGDGRADLIAAAQSDNASVVFILKGLPGGGFGRPVRLASGWPTFIGQELPIDLAVDDFNGDGRPDIAVLNSNGGYYNVTILAGQGDGSFAVSVRHRVPWLPGHMAVADFNGDGKPDLLLDASVSQGGGLKVVTNTSPDLAQVVPSTGTLTPAFSGDVTEYTLYMPQGGPALTLTPWLAFGTATVRVSGAPVASGSASAPINVPSGSSVPITVEVQARDGSTRTYTIHATRAVAVTATANPAAGGTAACSPSPVTRGSSATCTATASAGYRFTGWTGACAGQGTPCHLIDVQSAQASVALFAQEQTLAIPEGPQANQPLLLTLQALNGWRVAAASTHAIANANVLLPGGVTLPYGLVYLRLEQGVQGSRATVVLTYPQPLPQGAVYYKFGRTADNAQQHWYPFSGARISGNTVTLTLEDGGAGDDDLTQNSVIHDPGGVALLAPLPPGPASATAIPTLQNWALWLLSLLAILVVWPRWRGPKARSASSPG